MKFLMILLGMILMINAQAVEQKKVDTYSTFSGVMGQMSLLSKKQNVLFETVCEINTLITGWAKENIRKKSLKLLAENGFDIARSKNIIVIEWGGGGISYRALYLSEKIFFVRKADDRSLQIEKTVMDKTLQIQTEVNSITEIMGSDKYIGNISGFGFDFQTYIVTILDGTGKEKTAIIYGASITDIKDKKDKTDNEKDTIAIWDLIMRIRKSFDIKPEGGA